MKTVIKVENLGKLYNLGEIGTGTASRDLARWWARVRGKEDPFHKIGHINDRTQKALKNEVVWALQNINLDVQEGDVVGIIGRNGAGKSTLLKIISRITAPSTGEVKIKGRVASLLEVGTGFHPEMTGRENVYMNGTILGMSRNEITRKLDDIVEFAGVAKYVDTPVKRYSSGMMVRLGFSVAAFLEPEILIVDEVLAVGDAEFQKKCLGKMDDINKKEGRTILFVSHNMAAVENLCSKGSYLDAGEMVFTGDIADCISIYQKDFSFAVKSKWKNTATDAKKTLSLVELEVALAGQQPDFKLIGVAKVQSTTQHLPAFCAINIHNSKGDSIMQAIPTLQPFIKSSSEIQEFTFEIILPSLIPGIYKLSFWLGSHFNETLDWQKEIVAFEVIQTPSVGRTVPHSAVNGYIVPDSKIVT